MIATGDMEARPDPFQIVGSSRYARHYGAVSEVWLRLLAAGPAYRWIDKVRYATGNGVLEPDGVIDHGGFFTAIEVDMGSEKTKQLAAKMAKYRDLHGDPDSVGQPPAPALLLVSLDEPRAAVLQDMASQYGLAAASVTIDHIEEAMSALPRQASAWRDRVREWRAAAARRRELAERWRRYDRDREGWERRRDAYVELHSGFLTTKAGLERKFAEQVEASPSPPDEPRPVDPEDE
jgi:hypothetical protein